MNDAYTSPRLGFKKHSPTMHVVLESDTTNVLECAMCPGITVGYCLLTRPTPIRRRKMYVQTYTMVSSGSKLEEV